MALAPLYLEFLVESPVKATVEEAITIIQNAIRRSRIWYCHYNHVSVNTDLSSEPPAGIARYVLVGRKRPHAIAVRSVFVSETYRRKGIAEALLRVVTRYYLGAESLGFDVKARRSRTEGEERRDLLECG